jgi:hypothetical protein
MKKCPCRECLMFIMCKQKGAISLQHLSNIQNCELLKIYLYNADFDDMPEISEVRIRFGIGPI